MDSNSVIIRPEVAEHHQQKLEPASLGSLAPLASANELAKARAPAFDSSHRSSEEQRPTRFQGTVMMSAERPARDMHKIVEGIIEQLSAIPGAEISMKLEIDAEVPAGLDRAKVRTLLENATTLWID